METGLSCNHSIVRFCEMRSKYAIQCEARNLFDFSVCEITEIVTVYNWLSWPKSFKTKKVIVLKDLFEDKLSFIYEYLKTKSYGTVRYIFWKQ